MLEDEYAREFQFSGSMIVTSTDRITDIDLDIDVFELICLRMCVCVSVYVYVSVCVCVLCVMPMQEIWCCSVRRFLPETEAQHSKVSARSHAMLWGAVFRRPGIFFCFSLFF